MSSIKMLEADNIVEIPSVLNEILAGQKLRETKSALQCLENVECLPVRKSKKLQNSKKKLSTKIKKRRKRCKNANNLICCCSAYKRRIPYSAQLKKANQPTKITNRLLLTKNQYIRLLSKPKQNYNVPNICGKPIKKKRKFTSYQVSDAFITRLSRPKRVKLLNTFQKYQKVLPASKLESIFKQLQRGSDDDIKLSEKRFFVKKTKRKISTKKSKKKDNNLYNVDCLAYKFSIKLTAFLTLQTNRNRNIHTIETIAELIFWMLRSADGICCHDNICTIGEDMWEYLCAAAHFLICILEHVYCKYEIIKKRSSNEDYESSAPSDKETEDKTTESSSEDSSHNGKGKQSYPHPQMGETSKEKKSPYYYTQVQQGQQSEHYIELTDDKYYKNTGQTMVSKLADLKRGRSPIKRQNVVQKMEPFLNQQYLEIFGSDAKTGQVLVQKLEPETQKGRKSSLSSKKDRQQISPKAGKQKDHKYLDSSDDVLRGKHKSADRREHGASKDGSPKDREQIPPKGRKQKDRRDLVSSDTSEDELRGKHKSADRRKHGALEKDRERISPKDKKEKHRKGLGSSPTSDDDRRGKQKSTRERSKDRKQISPKDGKQKDLGDLGSSDISDNYLRSKHKSQEDSPKNRKQMSPKHKNHREGKDFGSSDTSDDELRNKGKSPDRPDHGALKNDSPKGRKQISPKDKKQKDRKDLGSSDISDDELRGKHKSTDRHKHGALKDGSPKDREQKSSKDRKENDRKGLSSSPTYDIDKRDKRKSTDRNGSAHSKERSPDLRDFGSSDSADDTLKRKPQRELSKSPSSPKKQDSTSAAKQKSPKHIPKKDRDELSPSESYDDLRSKRKTGQEKGYVDSKGQKFDSKKPTSRVEKDRSLRSPDSSPRRHTSSSPRSNFSSSPLRQESPDTYGKESSESQYPRRKKYPDDKQFFKGATSGKSSPTSGTILDDLEKELSKSPTSDKKYFRTKQEYEVEKDVIRDERGRPVKETTTSDQKLKDKNDERSKSGYPGKSVTEYDDKDIDGGLSLGEKSDDSIEKEEFKKVKGKPKKNYGKKDEAQLSSDSDESKKYDSDEKQKHIKDKNEKEQYEKDSSSLHFNIPEFRKQISSKDRESPIEGDTAIKSSEKTSNPERKHKKKYKRKNKGDIKNNKKTIHKLESESESSPEDDEIQKRKNGIKDKITDDAELESEPSLSEVDDIQKRKKREKIKKEKDGTLESELESSKLKKASKPLVPDDNDAEKVKNHENNLDQITGDEKKELELPKTLGKIPGESVLNENVDDKADLSGISGITDSEIDTETEESEKSSKGFRKKQKKLPKSETSDSDLSIKSLPDYTAEDDEETIKNLKDLQERLYEQDKEKVKSMGKFKKKVTEDDDYLAGQDILKELEKEERSTKFVTGRKMEREEDEKYDGLNFLDDVIVLNVKESDSIDSDIMSTGPRKFFVFPKVKHPVYPAQNIRLNQDTRIKCPRIKCPDYSPITQKPSCMEYGSNYEKQKCFSSLTKCIVPHVNIMPHGTERICCASLKAWALWIKGVAESAKVWCQWINSIVCDMQTITALMRGEVYNERGKKRALTCKDWRNFVERFDSDISIWHHYNKHVQKNTKQILNYCNCARIAQYCHLCQLENLQCSSKNADHLYMQLAVALKTTKYWRTWLHSMILESQSLFDLIEVSCKYATYRPKCVCKCNDPLAQCSIYSIRSLNEDK